MNKGDFARRDVLKMTAAGALGVSAERAFAPGAAHAAGAAAYDPGARFELKVSEVEFRRNAAGRMLMARIYQPQGPGPFPTVLDLHGGAWNRKDRFAEEPMDRALAASGLLVVAVDLTLAPQAPYPACVQDANYAVRWLKANAAKWNVPFCRVRLEPAHRVVGVLHTRRIGRLRGERQVDGHDEEAACGERAIHRLFGEAVFPVPGAAVQIENGRERSRSLRLINPRHQHAAGSVAPKLDFADFELEPRARIIGGRAGRMGRARRKGSLRRHP